MWYRPLNSLFLNRIEVLNECVMIILLYGLMCFTDFVPDEEARSKIGLIYIGINILHILVHLFFLLHSTCYRFKLVCKRYKCCCFKPKIAKKCPMPAPLPDEESKQEKQIVEA